MDFIKEMEPAEDEMIQMGRDEPEETNEPAEQEVEAKEEPVKEEVKEEAKVETKVEPEVKAEPKMVPLPALHEARDIIKELKNKLAFVDDVKKQLDEVRLQKQKESIPKYEEDPLGNLDHRIKEQIDQKTSLEGKLQQIEQHQQAQAMAYHVTALENEFRRTTPDYDKALNFVLDVKKAEIEMLGVNDPELLNQEVAKIANSLSITALHQGKNPAEIVYGIAKRYGYKTEQPKPVSALGQLEAVKKAQDIAGKTLSKGGDVDASPSATKLASEKFNIFDPDFDKKWKEIFGDT